MFSRKDSEPKKPFSNIQLVDLSSEIDSGASSSHHGSKSTNFSDITHISESDFTTEACKLHFFIHMNIPKFHECHYYMKSSWKINISST